MRSIIYFRGTTKYTMRKRRTAKTREQRNQDAKERMRRVALERSMKLEDYVDDESIISEAISAFDKKREGGV